MWIGSIVVVTIGAAGTFNSGSQALINTAAAGSTVQNCGRTIAAVVDTTVNNLVEITFESGNAANTYTFNTAELLYFPS